MLIQATKCPPGFAWGFGWHTCCGDLDAIAMPPRAVEKLPIPSLIAIRKLKKSKGNRAP